jgi:hypothetical protein
VFVFACYIHSALFVRAVPEESPASSALPVPATPPFLLCIGGDLNFCSNKLLVELVWI